MSSRRLPGKVLRPLAGKPALQYLIERLTHCEQLDRLLIATSMEPSDDPVAEFCAQQGVDCHRGPLDDVALRYVEASHERGLDAFARVTGDSPLLDQRVVDSAVALFRHGDFDLVTNLSPSTFPSGQSVEVVDSRTYAAIYPELRDAEAREHVTPFFYRHPERFKIHNFVALEDGGHLDMSLDTEEDAQLIERMLTAMDRPHWQYDNAELVALYREVGGPE